MSPIHLSRLAEMADSLSRQNAIFPNLAQSFVYKLPFDAVPRTSLGSSYTSGLTSLATEVERTLNTFTSSALSGLTSNLSVSVLAALKPLPAFQEQMLTKLIGEFEHVHTHFLQQIREQAAGYQAYQTHASEYRRKLFTTLFEAHAPLLLHIARRIVRNEEDAQDIVQDTWEKAWRNLQNLSQVQKIKQWLCRIVYTTALNYRRQQQWLAPLDLDWLSQRSGSRFDQPEVALVRRELIGALDIALHTLPFIQRKTILLRFLAQEYSLAEIAACLSCKVGTVKSNLHRGLHALRNHLCLQGIHTHDVENVIERLIPTINADVITGRFKAETATY